VKEELLTSCKDEFGAAINTLQYFVCEFHGRLPRTGNILKSAMTSQSAGPVSLSSYVVNNKGPGRISLAAELVILEPEDRGDAAPSPTVRKYHFPVAYLRPGRFFIYSGGESNGALNIRQF
jgi:hypothetical protein